MSFLKKVLPLVAVGALALGIAAVPTAAANAATATGTITVQLYSVTGKALHKSGIDVGWGTSSTGSGASTNSKGQVIFKKRTVYSHYTITAGYGSAYVVTRKTNVKVTKGKTTTVKVTMATGGSISGVLTDSTAAGAGAEGLTVSAKLGSKTVGYATTSSTGAYKFVGLASGAYKVYFNPTGLQYYPVNPDFSSSFYAKGTATAPTSLTVKAATKTKAATSTKGIDGSVAENPSKLTVAYDLPEAAEEVDIYDLDDNFVAEKDLTGTTGTASISLGEGEYTAVIYTENDSYFYAGTGVDASTDSADAATITMDGVSPVSVNIKVTPIPTSDVRISFDLPEAATSVSVYNDDYSDSADVSEGIATLTLPAGSYTVVATAGDVDYYYTGAGKPTTTNSDKAVPLVMNGTDNAEINLSYSKSTITFSVGDGSNELVYATVYDENGEVVSYAAADNDGNFTTTLEAGNYTVSGEFPNGDGALDEWYWTGNDSASAQDADAATALTVDGSSSENVVFNVPVPAPAG